MIVSFLDELLAARVGLSSDFVHLGLQLVVHLPELIQFGLRIVQALLCPMLLVGVLLLQVVDQVLQLLLLDFFHLQLLFGLLLLLSGLLHLGLLRQKCSFDLA